MKVIGWVLFSLVVLAVTLGASSYETPTQYMGRQDASLYLETCGVSSRVAIWYAFNLSAAMSDHNRAYQHAINHLCSTVKGPSGYGRDTWYDEITPAYNTVGMEQTWGSWGWGY